jgi:hypothetical protein
LDSLTPEVLGSGWFDRRLENLHEGTDPDDHTFFTSPRAYDSSPTTVPLKHPLRAIARLLHDASPRSIVRVYAYMLTDYFCIDMLIHHGAGKDVRVVLHPDDKTYARLKEFFTFHGVLAHQRAFLNRVHVRIANSRGAASTKFTQMHDTSILTDNRCTFGSYNLTNPARCANWESLHLTTSRPVPAQEERFDALYDSLAGREIDVVDPGLFPNRRQRLQETN